MNNFIGIGEAGKRKTPEAQGRIEGKIIGEKIESRAPVRY